jgi:hypothetical protein
MNGAIKKRFDALETRREAFTDRVRALTPEKQNAKPAKGFSPVELLTHFALVEAGNLEYLRKDPPRTLTGRTPKTRFMYRKVVSSMQSAQKQIGTLPSMKPKGKFTFESGARQWGVARAELSGFLEQVDDPQDPFCQFMFLFGLASADEYLTLMEAHMHYHEVLFPAPRG